jgi:purine-nucleoside phosphorylase
MINMEVSPFYAASASCGVRSLWLGYVSDRLIDDEWESWHGEHDYCRQQVNRLVVKLIQESSASGKR